VLRCERVIRNKEHTNTEIRVRWLRSINTRLTEDKIIATLKKRDQRFTSLVKRTWETVLDKKWDLPNE
jgi:hypothetical protein